jgi:hypothetical protein
MAEYRKSQVVPAKIRRKSDQYNGEKTVPSTSSFTPEALAGYIRTKM